METLAKRGLETLTAQAIPTRKKDEPAMTLTEAVVTLIALLVVLAAFTVVVATAALGAIGLALFLAGFMLGMVTPRRG